MDLFLKIKNIFTKNKIAPAINIENKIKSRYDGSISDVLHKLELETILNLYIKIRTEELLENIDHGDSIEDDILKIRIEYIDKSVRSCQARFEDKRIIKREKLALENILKAKQRELKNLFEKRDLFYMKVL